MLGNKHTNMQSDMYRIYGISKNDMIGSQIAPTPKTSNGKRDSTSTGQMGFRVNAQSLGNRISQKQVKENRSVSPNRIIVPGDISEKDIFAPQMPNISDVLGYQTRNNNIDKEMPGMIGTSKRLNKKRAYKGNSNMFSFNKPSPTQKRVKSSAIGKNPIVGIHKRFMSNKTPYNQPPIVRVCRQL